MFFDAFWLSKTEYKSQFTEFKITFNKRAGVQFFDKNHGLTPLENFLTFSALKSILFYPEDQNDLVWLDLPKKTQMIKSSIF